MIDDFCVISSNCISGFWYRDVLKTEYENPFIWTNIKMDSFLPLIKKFGNIDLSEAKAIMSENEIIRKAGNKWVKMVIEDISIYFAHCRESKTTLKEPIINGFDVICTNVIDYAEKTWKKRCKRIPYYKKRVWVFWDDTICTNCSLDKFVNIAKERQDEIFVLFTQNANKFESSGNLIVLPITNYNNVGKHAKDLKAALENYEKKCTNSEF